MNPFENLNIKNSQSMLLSQFITYFRREKTDTTLSDSHGVACRLKAANKYSRVAPRNTGLSIMDDSKYDFMASFILNKRYLSTS